MAKTAAAVERLLVQVGSPAKEKRGRGRGGARRNRAPRRWFERAIRAMGLRYYAEKVRQVPYYLEQRGRSEALFRPRQHCAGGVSTPPGRLFGLNLNTDARISLSVTNPELRVWEVRDRAGGAISSGFCRQFHTPSGKQSGPGRRFRDHESMTSPVRLADRPSKQQTKKIFARGNVAGGEPTLLSFDARNPVSLFGHGFLHALLSTCPLRSPSGTSVLCRDFV